MSKRRRLPEGFTISIDVPTAGFTLPWKGRATLDSNPKSIGADGRPSAANVGAAVDFVVGADGKITFANFAIDPIRPASRATPASSGRVLRGRGVYS